MKKLCVAQIHPRGRAAWIVMTAALLLALAGCAGQHGGFTVDAQVTQDFEAGVIRPGFDYYYAGRDDMPYAIMAVDSSYRVPSRYWISFEPRPEQLKEMSGNIYGKHRYDPYGSRIRSAEGETVGVWYSNVRTPSVTVDPTQKTVEVLFPNPENDDRGGGALRFG